MNRLLHGDCLALLRELPEASVDSIVTDPPYELGFMGKAWDSTGIANNVALWREALRVLKPGGHLLAFSGTRTYHRMVCAIEDAGFEIRDQLGWVYGSGFPKSHNGEWGGTALKPAWEPIVMARKPLIGTVEANWLAYGTGALNIDACRVDAEAGRPLVVSDRRSGNHTYGDGLQGSKAVAGGTNLGRWPANIIHDGSDEVLAAFPQDGKTGSGAVKVSAGGANRTVSGSLSASGMNVSGKVNVGVRDFGDGGSAARFFYCAKASKKDREEGNTHPTVKPTELMRWLVRLVTPKGGVALDPFTGSGSTGKAAVLEGVRFIGCELSPEYIDIATARIRAVGGELSVVRPATYVEDLA